MPHTLPSTEIVRSFVNWLDDSQNKYNGGDWRSIYPKTATLATQILHNAKVNDE